MSSPILQAESLRSAGVRHGFSTRVGGTSVGPFASFNLSTKVGDEPSCVAANRVRWEDSTGFRWEAVVELEQVHGAEVLVVDEPVVALPPALARRFDAAVTQRNDTVLAVRTADCVPVLLYCPQPRSVGIVHAGWRGSLSGVAAMAVATMESQFGCRPAVLHVAIGPCIHTERFLVGPEVHTPFLARFGTQVALRKGQRLALDLVAANRCCLLEAGCRPEHIEDIDLCTFSREDLFFSHRRDEGRTGRQMAHISLAT
ncbi:MAG: peptidoglycan editing factor PgeF [Deltaproteobacteria bacterium]|nr:peptidoglycan editing factor PgeF [Deltaproteobacteria bacterium]